MAYATCAEVRLLGGISITEMGDEDLKAIMDIVPAQFNSDIIYKVEDEQVTKINSEKTNEIDGSNTTFYAKDVDGNPKSIGDRDNDGTVDENDIYAYTLDSSSPRVRTACTISSLDSSSLGKFTLASAPTSDETLFISYVVAPIDCETPSALVKLAFSQLCSIYVRSKLTASNLKRFRIGKVSVTGGSIGLESASTNYRNSLDKINAYLSSFQDNEFKI